MTPIQKRASSYSNTINALFTEITTTRQPADRVLATYFKLNKKHGSKDRRIIRETLFGLFRWHGWLKQLETNTESWLQQLAITGVIEGHTWHDIIETWATLGGLSINSSSVPLSPEQALSWLTKLFPQYRFSLTDLLPDWFWQQLPSLTVIEKANLINAMSQRPPIWARAQRITATKLIAELEQNSIAATRSSVFADAVNLGSKSINLPALASYKKGYIEIQDLASQVIGNICDPLPHQHWWDACCGAGGKTLQLYSLMQQQCVKTGNELTGYIDASDIRQNALNELIKRAQRADFKKINIHPWQTSELPVEPNKYDGVLVDAPCSCTGTWRRNPDMRWLDNAGSHQDKPPLQLDILSRASKAVAKGGALIYATCSLANAENQDVVDQFLKQNSAFELQPLIHPFTGKTQQYLTIWPFEANSDGMFVVKMRRNQ